MTPRNQANQTFEAPIGVGTPRRNTPNAAIHVPAPEWAFWMDEGEMARAADVWKANFGAVRRVFGPIANDVQRFDWGKEVVPGITTVDARGHTAGHTAFAISSGNAKLLVISDTTNNPALFARNPEWQLWADMLPQEAIVTRRRLLDLAASEHMPIAGYHYPFPATGYIAREGNGYAYVPASWQSIL